jgi:ribosomal-protein-alanine N-acetyltransferase
MEIERGSISPPWSEGSLLSELYNEDSYFAVAAAAGGAGDQAPVIIGFIILRRAADEGELLQIAVDEPYRRLGAADALIRAAVAWAAGLGLGSIYLELRASNGAAAQLYKKHGFTRSGRRKGYYTDPDEDALLYKREFF